MVAASARVAPAVGRSGAAPPLPQAPLRAPALAEAEAEAVQQPPPAAGTVDRHWPQGGPQAVQARA